MRFGAIDIGTNAARLLIGELTDENGRTFVNKISYTRIPLRLGEDVFTKGKISKDKALHFRKTMKAFVLLAEIFDVRDLRACATSAMREASNGEKIKKKIWKDTGLEIDIITGDEEAQLIFNTFFLLDIDKTNPFIVVDVGGGSTEISLFKDGVRVNSCSFDIGTLRLLKEKTNPEIWQDIIHWMDKHVLPNKIQTLYATGGNINKAHKMLGGQVMDPISVERIQNLYDELQPLSVRQRMERFQLKPDRADVIIPALDIYLFIMKYAGIQSMIVPKIGLSDGIIYNLHQKYAIESED